MTMSSKVQGHLHNNVIKFKVIYVTMSYKVQGHLRNNVI